MKNPPRLFRSSRLRRGRRASNLARVADWFRSSDWSSEAQEDFETRLRRARPHSRSQYLRIKSLALIEAGQVGAAVSLLHRVIDDHADDWIQVTSAHEHLGDIYQSTGDLAGAESEFRRVLALSPTLSATSGEVHLKLGEVLLAAGADDFAELERLIAAARPHAVFNKTAFRANVLEARVAAAVGDVARCRESATAALLLVDAPTQFSRHPTVGLVDASESLLAEMSAMAKAPNAPKRRWLRRT